MFEEAIALDPNYPAPYALLGWTHLMDVWFCRSKSPITSMEHVFELAQKTLALDDSLGEGHNLLGKVYLFKRQYGKAIAEAEQSIALEPNNAFNIFQLAETLMYAGRSEESITLYKQALRPELFLPSHFYHGLGGAYLLTGQYNKAIAACRKAMQRSLDSLFAHINLGAAYALSGREEEARAEVAAVLRIYPKFSIECLAKTWPYRNKADTEIYVEALGKAGMK